LVTLPVFGISPESAWHWQTRRHRTGTHIHLDAGINPLDLGSVSLTLARHIPPPKP
jgi:hypothetical protein